MSTDLLTVIGLVIGGLGVAVAAASGSLGAIFGYRAVVASRQAVAEARSARSEDRLQCELARYEHLMDIIKRMWVVINLRRRHPGMVRTPAEADDLDALLYELRAGLATLTQEQLPKCYSLAFEYGGDSMSGQPLVGNPPDDPGVEAEVKLAIDRVRGQLARLHQIELGSSLQSV